MHSDTFKQIKLLLIITGVIACWLLVPSFFYLLSDDLDKAGQLGDLFGIVNALFSGLAFAILIVELNFQRQELKLTRQAMMDQKDQLKDQSEELKKQNYERLFFNLLYIISEEIDSVTGQREFEKEEGFTLLRTVAMQIDSQIPSQTNVTELGFAIEKLLKTIIKQEFDKLGLDAHKEFIHFGLTSQDVNNTATPLLLKEFLETEFLPQLINTIKLLEGQVIAWKDPARMPDHV